MADAAESFTPPRREPVEALLWRLPCDEVHQLHRIGHERNPNAVLALRCTPGEDYSELPEQPLGVRIAGKRGRRRVSEIHLLGKGECERGVRTRRWDTDSPCRTPNLRRFGARSGPWHPPCFQACSMCRKLTQASAFPALGPASSVRSSSKAPSKAEMKPDASEK